MRVGGKVWLRWTAPHPGCTGGQVEFSRQKRGCSNPILMSLAGGADRPSPIMEQGGGAGRIQQAEKGVQ